MSQLPLYQQIKNYILEQIDSGQWTVGTRIATELELTKQFSVSRMTVNKALRDLVNDGRLERTPRLGTFVCQPIEKSESPLTDIRNIADEISARGKQYSNEILQHKSLVADETIATKLGVKLGSKVYFSEILHYADTLPIQLEQRWVNPVCAPDYLKQNFSQFTPTEYLFNSCPLSAIEHSVEAVIANTMTRQCLHLAPNEPCLLLHRRTWSGQQLVSSALLYHPAFRYKLSSTINLLG
ncbi:histidine utilization repressor [Vibrio ichthyoenteri ATCC 700023]|uniref:Histidine utilization repressor n=1 Tax=Vibrio ichthyoenteri ATCC 700023 TaxID=870968 RepID=F9S249_9VIBR|nr:histidine utilization repressor [Vibrio ichthyoenteri]EGU40088.1 histidine utilization repressor [Vibrio ichthyoenteri ATCC 700023]